MSTFWNLWTIIAILLFFVVMIVVVIYYWKKNHTADADKTLDTFDGIAENDAPAPKLLFISYTVAAAITVGYLILYQVWVTGTV